MTTAQQTQQKNGQQRMTSQQLLHLDFGKLSQRELQLFDKLSKISVHNIMYRILTKPYGDSRYKQKCVKQNLNLLGPDDEVDYNLNKMEYKQKISTFVPLILGGFTLGAYLTGVWTLPSRKRFGCGLAISYGLWRYWTFQYYEKLNKHFAKILKLRYTSKQSQ